MEINNNEDVKMQMINLTKMKKYENIYLSLNFSLLMNFFDVDLQPMVNLSNQHVDLLQKIYKEGIVSKEGYELCDEYIDLLSKSFGVRLPIFYYTDYDEEHSRTLALSSSENVIVMYKKFDVAHKKFNGYTFAEYVLTIRHEMQHIFQYNKIKDFYHNRNLSKQDETMAILLTLKTITQNDNDAPQGEYYADMMEIDARIRSCEYILALIKHPHLEKSEKQELIEFAKKNIYDDVTAGLDLGTEFKKDATMIINYFKEIANNCAYDGKLNKIKEKLDDAINTVNEYSEYLTHYQNGLKQKIDAVINDNSVINDK